MEKFDVEALAQQLEAMGAKYFVITLGQNSGYFNLAQRAPTTSITGYAPGERAPPGICRWISTGRLKPKGIRLMLYLPCQTPNQDAARPEGVWVAARARRTSRSTWRSPTSGPK